MKQLIRGSVPVLVIGASPGSVAAASALIEANVPVTLLGEGRPLGGRGALSFTGNTTAPLWPPSYQHYPARKWNFLATMLSKAHAKGVCVQSDERLREVKVEDSRVVEITTEGVLGRVKRRPRLIILGSRVDHFLQLMSPPLSSDNPNDSLYLDGSVTTLSWDGNILFPEQLFKGACGRIMQTIPSTTGEDGVVGCTVSRVLGVGESPSAEQDRAFFQDNLSAFGFAQGLPQGFKSETRIVQTVSPNLSLRKTSAQLVNALTKMANLVPIGSIATATEMTMKEEVSEATKLVHTWTNSH